MHFNGRPWSQRAEIILAELLVRCGASLRKKHRVDITDWHAAMAVSVHYCDKHQRKHGRPLRLGSCVLTRDWSKLCNVTLTATRVAGTGGGVTAVAAERTGSSTSLAKSRSMGGTTTSGERVAARGHRWAGHWPPPPWHSLWPTAPPVALPIAAMADEAPRELADAPADRTRRGSRSLRL